MNIIDRVREVQDMYKELRNAPNVIVEPQIAMMESAINEAIAACANGDAIEMIRCYNELKGFTE